MVQPCGWSGSTMISRTTLLPSAQSSETAQKTSPLLKFDLIGRLRPQRSASLNPLSDLKRSGGGGSCALGISGSGSSIAARTIAGAAGATGTTAAAGTTGSAAGTTATAAITVAVAVAIPVAVAISVAVTVATAVAAGVTATTSA